MGSNSPNQQGLINDLSLKVEVLKKKINQSIIDTNGYRQTNKKKASMIKVFTVVSTGVITILLGIRISGYEELFLHIAFFLGALIIILNALEPFFNFRTLWIESELAVSKFYTLRDEFDFYTEGTKIENLSEVELNRYYKLYQEIWNSLNKTWFLHRRNEDSIL